MTRASRRAGVRAQDEARGAHEVTWSKVIAWSSSNASTAANFILVSYVTIYCTDTLGLSPGIVGGLLLASKLVDAVCVLAAGYLVDITPATRWGKARPYELALVGLWVCTALLFSTPGAAGAVVKYAWVFVTYVLLSAIFLPLLHSNDSLYLARAFPSRQAYTTVAARSGVVTGLFPVAVAIGFPILVAQVGKSPEGWSRLIVLFSIPLLLFGLFRLLVISETTDTEPVSLPRIRLHDIRTVLRTNPGVWAVAGLNLTHAAINLGGLPYYFRYIVGDIALQGLVGAVALSIVPFLPLLPRLILRYSVSQVIMVGSGAAALGWLIYGFAGTSIPLLMVAALLTALGSVPLAFLLPVLIIDNATYNQYRGNRRLESIGGALSGFARNVGAGLAAGLAGLVLTWAGYDGVRDAQAPPAMLGIIAITSWLPAALAAACALVAFYYLRIERRFLSIAASVRGREEEAAAALAAAAIAPGFDDPVAQIDPSLPVSNPLRAPDHPPDKP